LLPRDRAPAVASVPSRDGRAPHLVDRIQAASRLDEKALAEAIGCTYQALRKLKGKDRRQLVAVNRDPLWAQLDAFVAEQIGAMLAIREELAVKLETDRRRQLLERMRVERR
jgi:hypothetical protein